MVQKGKGSKNFHKYQLEWEWSEWSHLYFLKASRVWYNNQNILLHFEGNGKSHGWLNGFIYAGGEGGVSVCLSADCHKIMRMRPRVAPFCLMKGSLSPPVDSRALATRNATNKLVGMARFLKFQPMTIWLI